MTEENVAFNEKYPLHALMKAEEGRRAVVQEVLDWIEEQGWTVCELLAGGDYEPAYHSKAAVIGMFFGVDPQAFDREKVAMLEEFRAGKL